MSGLGFVKKDWPLSGRLLLRILLMLVMLGLGSSVSGVLLFPCLPFATAQFERFFDCGRAVGCMLPLGAGRFLHFGGVVWVSGC